MALTDGTYVARHTLRLSSQRYMTGDVVPGSAFQDDAQVSRYLNGGHIDSADATGAADLTASSFISRKRLRLPEREVFPGDELIGSEIGDGTTVRRYLRHGHIELGAKVDEDLTATSFVTRHLFRYGGQTYAPGTEVPGNIFSNALEALKFLINGNLDVVAPSGGGGGGGALDVFSLASSPPADQAWQGVTWSPELGLFCAVQAGSTPVTTSPDGDVWTARVGVSGYWNDVAWSPALGLFVAVADSGANRVMTSPDGITWTPRTVPSSAWMGITWSPELALFVAVSTSSTDNVMTSPDGINWTVRGTLGADQSWRSVAWSAALGLFVAVSDTPTGSQVVTSPDGITWTLRTTAVDGRWYGVTWSPELGLFCAVAAIGTQDVMTSPDGINWTARVSPDGYWKRIVWAANVGSFVASSMIAGGNNFMTSPDGINWTVAATPADQDWTGLAWAPEINVLVGVAANGTGTRAMKAGLA